MYKTKIVRWTRAGRFLYGLLALAYVAAADESFTFVQLGDPQLGFGGYEQDLQSFEQAVQQINVLNPAFVLICGDLVNHATDESFADFLRIQAKLHVPAYCVAGNHDIGSPPTPASLERYRRIIGRDYYSFEHSNRLFVAVNTQLWKTPLTGESEKQDAWLRETLDQAAARDLPVFIVGHHPFFLKTPDEPEEYFNLPASKRTELLNLFEKRGVVAVLGGHAHKLILNNSKGIQFVNVESVSKNFEEQPLGFRLWHIEKKRPFRQEFIPLKQPSASSPPSPSHPSAVPVP